MTVGQPSASGEGLIELDDSPTLFPQYPDPDSAANITSYPWLAEPDEEPSPPPRPSLEASDEMGSDDDSLTSVSELFWDIGPNPDDASRPEVDSEYRDFENPDRSAFVFRPQSRKSAKYIAATMRICQMAMLTWNQRTLFSETLMITCKRYRSIEKQREGSTTQNSDFLVERSDAVELLAWVRETKA